MPNQTTQRHDRQDFPVGRNELFAPLPDEEIESLAAAARPVQLATGQVLFRCGEPGEHVYVLTSGSIAIEAAGPNGCPVVVNYLKPGEMFGEMAVLQDAPRSATATALEPCELLAIQQADFLAMLVAHPSLSIRILGTVTSRLRRLTQFVASVGT